MPKLYGDGDVLPHVWAKCTLCGQLVPRKRGEAKKPLSQTPCPDCGGRMRKDSGKMILLAHTDEEIDDWTRRGLVEEVFIDDEGHSYINWTEKGHQILNDALEERQKLLELLLKMERDGLEIPSEYQEGLKHYKRSLARREKNPRRRSQGGGMNAR